MSVNALEVRRLRVQKQLDSSKSPMDRSHLGQFATPPALAQAIIEYGKSLLPPKEKVHFLDPAFGTGSFYSALMRRFLPARRAQATGFEIDSDFGRAARDLWGDSKLALTIGDFTRAEPPPNEGRSNFLVCNPPYVRHHYLTQEEKKRLGPAAQQAAGIKLSGLAGLYCYFLCLAHPWMTDDGLALWLIPSEFMDVNYGKGIRSYLTERVTLLRIHRFNPSNVQFGDALVSSVVVSFRKTAPPSGHRVEFSFDGSLDSPELLTSVPIETLRREKKWTRFPLEAEHQPVLGLGLRLGDLFEIKRGIATGANKFFVMTVEDAASRGIPSKFLRPILPGPRHLPQGEIEADGEGDPLLEPRLVVLDCDLPEEHVESEYPRLWEYLQRGIADGVRERYICAHRSPWYSQEARQPPAIVCTYMGRTNAENRKPFRFILNRSRATAPNVYLMLYPKPPLAGLLHREPARLRAVWEALNSIPTAALLRVGRVYGGGLHKLEPRELMEAPADGVLKVFPELEACKAEQLALL